MKNLKVFVCLALVLVGIGLALLWVPEWMVNQYGGGTLSRLDYTKAADDYRKTLAQILGGFALLVGLYFTWRTTRATEDGRITDRFSKAVEQLGTCNNDGHKQLEPRLGGIYALERIARDSERDRWPIIEILCAYIRSNAPRKFMTADPETGEPSFVEPKRRKPEPDIQAVLKVLSDLLAGFDAKSAVGVDLNTTEMYLADLSECSLSNANMQEVYLEEATLSRGQLRFTDLRWASLERARLTKADLEGANLYRANLKKADLYGAVLKGTNLSEANLQKAKLKNAIIGFSGKKATNLRGANLEGTDLRGTDLTWAWGLTAGQISKALTDETTKLPESLTDEPTGGTAVERDIGS